MKIASFRVDERATYGVLSDGGVFEARADFRALYPDLKSVLAADALGKLQAALDQDALRADAIDYLPTIPNPDKVICIGVNYRPHLEEMGHKTPEYPVTFVRFSNSQVGHGQPLIKSPATEKYDFEGELAVVIGRPAHCIREDEVFDCIAGYTCFMDGTARDWQRHTTQFTPGKNFDRSGAMGPCLVSRDEVADVSQLTLETRVNGDIMQSGRLDELIFDIPALLVYLSTFTRLSPGDVIATGTPGGVGAARTPPRWLNAGDEVVVDIPGIGLLANRIRAA